MDSKKNPDVKLDIGGDSFPEPSPDFRDDRAAQRIAADALIGMLPWKYKQAIHNVTKARGMNRSSKRATRTLVRLGIRQANRNTRKLQARKDDKEARELSLFLRIEKRLARGIDAPLPGMTSERYGALKQAYGRVESLQINGEQIEQLGGALVRMKDNEVVIRQQ